MKEIRLRISAEQWRDIHVDLSRPHRLAHERFGLLGCKLALAAATRFILLPVMYEPILDSEYQVSKEDPTILIGSAGIRHAMTFAHVTKLTCLYVHVHAHRGAPKLSGPDLEHGRGMIADLLNASRQTFHGFFVFSQDAASGLVSADGITFFELQTPTLIYGRKTVIR